jgi:hypothetical protein
MHESGCDTRGGADGLARMDTDNHRGDRVGRVTDRVQNWSLWETGDA